jgi:hypothetical protein
MMRIALMTLGLVACASAPTPIQQAGVGTYGAALQGCVAQAKASDGGDASYLVCAHKVDVAFGRADGGT